ncbi:MAG TPA: MlaD family protein, partial [Puia sp.]|nr:MlaD family protein [Puia sp.]
LQSGNNVWLSGMKIGTVKKLSFYGDSKVDVILSIEKQAQPHIRRDAKARVSTDGLVGNKIVVLTGGSDSAPPVADNDRLESEHLPGMQDMLETLQSSNANLLAITGNLKAVSEKLKAGNGTLGELLNDSSFAQQLRGSIDNLRLASAGSARMMSNLDAFASRLRNSNGLVNELITDSTVFQRLRGAVGKFNEAAASASAFSASLQNAGQGLNDDHSPAGVLLHDEQMADDLQRTFKNLRVSSQELSDDLEAVQHNFLLKGFFRKKRKAAQ